MDDYKSKFEKMVRSFSDLDIKGKNPFTGTAMNAMGSSSVPNHHHETAEGVVANKVPDVDHPEGDEIRRQVEFYFSDENLPNDEHLRNLCRGTKNKPVSLGQVLSWRKMRRFKPKSLVIAALKKSNFLEVIDDKLIRRRVPWDGTWMVPGNDRDPQPLYREPFTDADFPSGEEEEEILELPFSSNSEEELEYVKYKAVPPPGFKFDKNGGLVLIRPRTAKKPTGLEEYFAEAPMTVEEAVEAEEIFGKDLGIVNRIEVAIQRYFHNRKLDQDSRRILEAFLRFGGVNTSPKPFARLDRQHIDDLNVHDKRAALATHHIMPEKFDSEHWNIDFLHIAKGFLSSYFPNQFAQKDENPEVLIETACKILINFYNYLLYHKVCPEKDAHDSILYSRALASTIAPPELAVVFKIPHLLPGRWSKAVAKIWDFNHDEDTLLPSDEDANMTIDDAKKLVLEGILSFPLHDLEEFINAHVIPTPNDWHKRIRVLFKGIVSVEVVSIYASPNEDEKVASVGLAVCKPWWNPGNDIYDIPEAHMHEPEYLKHCKDPMEVYIDNIGLLKLIPEMKLEGKMMHLDFGTMGRIWVMGGNVKAYCSFYTVCLNDLPARQALKAPHLEKIEVHDPNPPKKSIPSDWEIPEPHPYCA